jgi:hypothetical protein
VEYIQYVVKLHQLSSVTGDKLRGRNIKREREKEGDGWRYSVEV